MEAIEGNMRSTELETGFRFHEQLIIAKKDIENFYKPAENKVYRTFISNPPTEIDFTPQLFRDEEDGTIDLALSQEEYDKLPGGKRKHYIAERGLSVNETEERAIEAAKSSFKNVEKKHGTEDAEVYMEEQRGVYVGEIRWKPGQALISKTGKDGHFTVLLNQDVNWEDIEVFGVYEYAYRDE